MQQTTIASILSCCLAAVQAQSPLRSQLFVASSDVAKEAEITNQKIACVLFIEQRPLHEGEFTLLNKSKYLQAICKTKETPENLLTNIFTI